MKYREGMQFDPPRPETAVPPGQLPMYEGLGWWAQQKLNGTYNIIYVAPSGAVRATTRRHEKHKLWSWTQASIRPFECIPTGGWWVFCAELLHSKGDGRRDVNFVHDVIVADGEVLNGRAYKDRYQILRSVLDPLQDDHLMLAVNYTEGFAELFDGLPAHCEGLVLKDPLGQWKMGKTTGMLKCRRPHANYSFSWLAALGIPMSIFHLAGLLCSESLRWL